jgi:ABC-2 type transport system permease protein
MSAISPPALGGAVYDRGYRPYEGIRGGRAAGRWALWRLTLRRALGLRRSWRQKVLPWTLLGLVTIPAAVDLGVRYATRNTPLGEIGYEFLTFRDYVGVSTMLLLFVAVSAPDVICPDRHDRVLPLIFSRPLTGDDYVLAKVGGIFTLVFGFSFFPQVLLYIGQMLVNEDGSLTYVGDHLDVLWQVPLSVAILALYYAVVSVAVASLTDRRIVGGLAFLGVLFIPAIIAGAIVGAANRGEGTIFGVFNLLNLPLMLRDIVFEGQIDVDRDAGLSGVAGAGWAALALYVAIVSTGLFVLHRRYREARL